MAQLNISELFQPAPSGVGSTASATPSEGSWLAQLLQIADSVGLDVTAWQSGGVARTILALVSTAFGQEDALVSVMAQGGFLDFAATGTVTYVAANGIAATQPVTPDPSIPAQNATGAPGWLDVLADSVYDVQRLPASYASGSIAVANTTAGSYGPYVAGTYHVANPTTQATYANVASLTIPSGRLAGTAGVITGVAVGPPGTITTQSAHGLATGNVVYVAGVVGVTGINGSFFTITVTSTTAFQLQNSTLSGAWSSGGTAYLATVATFQADVLGPGSTSSAATITQAVTTNIGTFVSNAAALVGANWESNTALAARCRLRLQALSPNGPKGAYQYFALTASQLLLAETPPVTLRGGPITQVLVVTDPLTGIVTTTLANTSPAALTLNAAVVEGVSNLAITAATNASPIVVTTASAHNLANGDFVTISGGLGNTAVNGTWTIAAASGSTFQLVGSTGNGTYSASSATLEGGDLGEVDAILQANVVPDNTTAVTQSALAFPITVVASVVVPAGKVTEYQTNVALALTAYFGSLPIGGVIPPGGSQGVLQYDDVLGVVFQAGSVNNQPSYVQQITSLTLDAGGGPVTTSIAFTTATWRAVLPAPSITVQGV